MRSLVHRAVADNPATTCMVCLPGAYHTPEDFVSAGFHTRVAERGLPIDMVFVDAELQHLGDRSFRDRLQRDVLQPARVSGHRSIWLLGISLGGFMALDYAASHPDELAGLCLLAPYLGNRMLTGEIARAPSLRAWQPGELADSDEERQIWRFIQAQPAGSRWMHLGFGREDRFVHAHRLMAQALPQTAVHEVPGGHDWVTWNRLWEKFLDSRFA
jgi:pimeloyl-ACP methyl ester carboxylesterase